MVCFGVRPEDLDSHFYICCICTLFSSYVYTVAVILVIRITVAMISSRFSAGGADPAVHGGRDGSDRSYLSEHLST